jgi:hypothetical protein
MLPHSGAIRGGGFDAKLEEESPGGLGMVECDTLECSYGFALIVNFRAV